MMYRIMVSQRRAGEDTVVRYSGNKDRDSRGQDDKEGSAEGKVREKKIGKITHQYSSGEME